ncbi:ATP-binding cassette domain-containing protein [Nitrospirales bacterium NOB]|nr:ATP-binding cassette domain-containing protein [Nitrospirales bacterium NOB]
MNADCHSGANQGAEAGSGRASDLGLRPRRPHSPQAAVSPSSVPPSPTILCKDLHFSYPGGSRLFDGISFELNGPGLFGIAGDSGVGKSTLAKIVSGLLHGWTASELSSPEPALYCYGEERLPSWQSAISHLKSITTPPQLADINILLDRFGLEDATPQARPGALSTGQRNRVNVARYLLQPFRLLILDEALSNVDDSMRYTILEYIKGVHYDKAVLYISHHLKDIAVFCRNVLALRSSPDGVQARIIIGCDASRYADASTDRVRERLQELVEYV